MKPARSFKKAFKVAKRKYGADSPQAIIAHEEYTVALNRARDSKEAEAELAGRRLAGRMTLVVRRRAQPPGGDLPN